VQRLAAQFESAAQELARLPVVGNVRTIGGVLAMELVSDGGYLDQVGPQLAAAFLDRGLLLRPLGNVLYFMPPYVITEEETAWAIDQIAEILGSGVIFGGHIL
jgi:adenosylmethionine-8-amino-7-oxononanoate aminotransferase